jgi:lysophospholipase
VGTLDTTPELGLGGPTYGWLAAAFIAMDKLNRVKGPGHFRAPILIVAAGCDRIIDSDAARRFAQATGLSYVTIPDSRHEILFERDEIRDQFFAAFDSFIGISPRDYGKRLVEQYA